MKKSLIISLLFSFCIGMIPHAHAQQHRRTPAEISHENDVITLGLVSGGLISTIGTTMLFYNTQKITKLQEELEKCKTRAQEDGFDLKKVYEERKTVTRDQEIDLALADQLTCYKTLLKQIKKNKTWAWVGFGCQLVGVSTLAFSLYHLLKKAPEPYTPEPFVFPEVPKFEELPPRKLPDGVEERDGILVVTVPRAHSGDENLPDSAYAFPHPPQSILQGRGIHNIQDKQKRNLAYKAAWILANAHLATNSELDLDWNNISNKLALTLLNQGNQRALKEVRRFHQAVISNDLDYNHALLMATQRADDDDAYARAQIRQRRNARERQEKYQRANQALQCAAPFSIHYRHNPSEAVADNEEQFASILFDQIRQECDQLKIRMTGATAPETLRLGSRLRRLEPLSKIERFEPWELCAIAQEISHGDNQLKIQLPNIIRPPQLPNICRPLGKQ